MVKEIHTDIQGIVEEFVSELSKRIRVERVFLFGSYAHGNPRPYSDIDLAVISPDFHGGTEEDHLLLAEVARKITPQIEALPYLPDDFVNCEKQSFEADVIQKGKIVFDKAA